MPISPPAAVGTGYVGTSLISSLPPATMQAIAVELDRKCKPTATCACTIIGCANSRDYKMFPFPYPARPPSRVDDESRDIEDASFEEQVQQVNFGGRDYFIGGTPQEGLLLVPKAYVDASFVSFAPRALLVPVAPLIGNGGQEGNGGEPGPVQPPVAPAPGPAVAPAPVPANACRCFYGEVTSSGDTGVSIVVSATITVGAVTGTVRVSVVADFETEVVNCAPVDGPCRPPLGCTNETLLNATVRTSLRGKLKITGAGGFSIPGIGILPGTGAAATLSLDLYTENFVECKVPCP